jgi:hypothetical protein
MKREWIWTLDAGITDVTAREKPSRQTTPPLTAPLYMMLGEAPIRSLDLVRCLATMVAGESDSLK